MLVGACRVPRGIVPLGVEDGRVPAVSGGARLRTCCTGNKEDGQCLGMLGSGL
jgi:hypothetical protein